jgi:C-terminal processing protease CtpA/Prc
MAIPEAGEPEDPSSPGKIRAMYPAFSIFFRFIAALLLIWCPLLGAEQAQYPETGSSAIHALGGLEDWMESSLDSEPVLSQKGKAAAQFKRVVKAIEEYRGRPLAAEEVARRFTRILESLQSKLKSAQDPARMSPEQAKRIGILADFRASIERDQLIFTGVGSRSTVVLNRNVSRVAADSIKKVTKVSGRTQARIANILWVIWIESCLDVLDSPFNYYIYSNQLTAYNVRSAGKTFCPGVVPAVSGDRIFAGEVYDPYLQRAGLVEGSELIAFNGQRLAPANGAIHEEWMRPTSYSYRLSFRNNQAEKTIRAEAIPFRHATLFWTRLQDVLYMHISEFSQDSMLELRRLFRDFRKTPLRGILIDLRGNKGGVENFGMVDFFFKPGQTIGTYKRLPDGKLETVPATIEYYEHPCVLLTDRHSASMSEVFAAAFAVHKRGLIVGEKTFGKGVGQTCSPVGDEGKICLIHTRYFFPGTDRTWDGEGIPPDVPAQIAEENGLALEHYFANPVPDIEEQLKVDAVLRQALHILLENSK